MTCFMPFNSLNPTAEKKKEKIIWTYMYMKFNFCILLHYPNILIVGSPFLYPSELNLHIFFIF